MVQCCIRGCGSESYAGCGLSFHRLPKDITRKAQWVELIRIIRRQPDWNPSNNSKVCSRHFQDEDIILSMYGIRSQLTATAVPMFEESIKDEPTEERSKDELDEFDPLQGSEPGSSEEMEDSNVDNHHHQPVFRYHCPTVTAPLSMGQKTKNRNVNTDEEVKTKNRRNDNTDDEVKTKNRRIVNTDEEVKMKNRRNGNTDDEVKTKNRRIVNTDEEVKMKNRRNGNTDEEVKTKNSRIVNTDEEVLDNSETTRDHRMLEIIDHLHCVAIANKRLKRITYLKQENLKLMKDNKELVDMVKRMKRKLDRYKKIIRQDWKTMDMKDEIKVDLEEIKIEEHLIEGD